MLIMEESQNISDILAENWIAESIIENLINVTNLSELISNKKFYFCGFFTKKLKQNSQQIC